jgi:hypothetical protein
MVTVIVSFDARGTATPSASRTVKRYAAKDWEVVAGAPTAVIDEKSTVIDAAAADADGAVITESPPKPKAATATSATRLKVVFVDICFLSISRSREFLPFGFELIS